MTANTPAETETVNPAYAALFDAVAPEEVEQMGQNSSDDLVKCPSLFVLGKGGRLNDEAKTGLTKFVKGKAVAPEAGTLFIDDNGEYTALSSNTQLYLLSPKLYVHYYKDQTKDEARRVVRLDLAKPGVRGPRNAEGAKKAENGNPATSGFVEIINAAVVVYCPDNDKAFPAKLTVRQATTRVVKTLRDALIPFLLDDTFKESADLLGLSAAEVKARLKDTPAFPSFRAGMESSTYLKPSSTPGGNEYTVWESDSSTLAAPSKEVLAKLKEATKTPQAQRVAESVMSNIKFVTDFLAGPSKEIAK